ncbi:hypothetical protein L7F22_000873 [Adiantum nelumboides]|nr:hypothetical protein [Adiantum nelumboides]
MRHSRHDSHHVPSWFSSEEIGSNSGEKEVAGADVRGQRRMCRAKLRMWGDLISKAKEGGLDVVQTYVFWNAHEPKEGNYDFEENLDLLKFLKLVQEAGLYVTFA